MLEIKYIRQNLSTVEQALKTRGDQADLETFKQSDLQRREVLQELEALRHRRNVVSDHIAEMKKSGEDADALVAEMRAVSVQIKQLEKKLAHSRQIIDDIIMALPNIPHATVPVGTDERDNPVRKTVGRPPQFDFEPQPHWEIGRRLQILDFERAAKIAGARFPLYLGAGARLERALINFMLDVHTGEHGYREVLPPFIVNRQTMTNTGQLPKFEEDLFKLADRDYYLIPTAEVPVTNIHQGDILDAELLPICYAAYPETSYEELESLLANAETILQRLGIAYQVVELCTGDLGFSAAKTYDIEVWMPAQGVYREISSCSNFEDFQARRANIRLRRKGQKGTELVHTINGSGLAVGRTVAALLENFQQPDGSVILPEALKSYMGGVEKITP